LIEVQPQKRLAVMYRYNSNLLEIDQARCFLYRVFLKTS